LIFQWFWLCRLLAKEWAGVFSAAVFSVFILVLLLLSVDKKGFFAFFLDMLMLHFTE